MNDNKLIKYVQYSINSGAKTIGVPMSLLNGASKEAIETVRQLCKLAGVELAIVPG